MFKFKTLTPGILSSQTTCSTIAKIERDGRRISNRYLLIFFLVELISGNLDFNGKEYEGLICLLLVSS